jgi:hypothetical protein
MMAILWASNAALMDLWVCAMYDEGKEVAINRYLQERGISMACADWALIWSA